MGITVKRTKTEFTEDYKMKIFMLWYNSGKPSSDALYSLIISNDIKEGFSGEIPSKTTVSGWVKKLFEAKATFLDLKANEAIEKQMISTKIEMLQEHAKLAQELHTMGMTYLRDNGLGNARNALSAVIDGIRIERESRGTEKLIELDKLSDKDLLAEFARLIEGSEIVSIEPNN